MQAARPLKSAEEGPAQYAELMEDETGFSHIAIFKDSSSPKPAKWLTSGPYEVVEIACDDFANGKM